MEISPAEYASEDVAQWLPQMPLDVMTLYLVDCELVRKLQPFLLNSLPIPNNHATPSLDRF